MHFSKKNLFIAFFCFLIIVPCLGMEDQPEPICPQFINTSPKKISNPPYAPTHAPIPALFAGLPDLDLHSLSSFGGKSLCDAYVQKPESPTEVLSPQELLQRFNEQWAQKRKDQTSPSHIHEKRLSQRNMRVTPPIGIASAHTTASSSPSSEASEKNRNSPSSHSPQKDVIDLADLEHDQLPEDGIAFVEPIPVRNALTYLDYSENSLCNQYPQPSLTSPFSPKKSFSISKHDPDTVEQIGPRLSTSQLLSIRQTLSQSSINHANGILTEVKRMPLTMKKEQIALLSQTAIKLSAHHNRNSHIISTPQVTPMNDAKSQIDNQASSLSCCSCSKLSKWFKC